MQFYREENSEICYPLQYFKENLEENQVLKLELEKREKKPFFFWCKIEMDFVERGCSNGCDNYSPCNGKSGRCKNYEIPFEGTGKYFELSKTGLIPVCA